MQKHVEQLERVLMPPLFGSVEFNVPRVGLVRDERCSIIDCKVSEDEPLGCQLHGSIFGNTTTATGPLSKQYWIKVLIQ
jgi:hypothetical protein